MSLVRRRRWSDAGACEWISGSVDEIHRKIVD
jgi:hypothetical protein